LTAPAIDPGSIGRPPGFHGEPIIRRVAQDIEMRLA
jgi:hypothetical protein